MNKVIVTGGAGFIGSNLVRRLIADGVDEVLIIDDFSTGKEENHQEGCNYVDADIRDVIDFDYFIINQDFDISVRELLSIIDSEKNKISNLNYSDVLTKLLN